MKTNKKYVWLCSQFLRCGLALGMLSVSLVANSADIVELKTKGGLCLSWDGVATTAKASSCSPVDFDTVRWQFTSGGDIRPKSDLTKCIEFIGAGKTVQLKTCSGINKQKWTLTGIEQPITSVQNKNQVLVGNSRELVLTRRDENFKPRRWTRRLIVPVVGGGGGTSPPATGYGITGETYAEVPPPSSGSVPPRVMFAMSNDHQLFQRAYSDYTDLDGDGVVDITYTDTFNYGGYFASNFCYEYDDVTDERFNPVRKANGPNGHYCSNDPTLSPDQLWSGNFLNWATMTRLDILKTVLYGGTRSKDTALNTILERTYIPSANPAFSKVYKKSDVNRFTPYTSAGLGGAISMCNVTTNTSGGKSQSDTSAPKILTAKGSWPYWSSAELVQCVYREDAELQLPQNTRPKDNLRLVDMTARVKVCVKGIDAEDNKLCKRYDYVDGSGVARTSYKPIGLMQRFGDEGKMAFGLITGSYAKNKDGGVLRRNIKPLTGNTGADSRYNEITETGEFVYLDRTLAQKKANPSMIQALDALRTIQFELLKNSTGANGVGYRGKYIDAEANLNLGNPIGEIYLEALRYFSAKAAKFSAGDDGFLPLLIEDTWEDPLDSKVPCAKCAVVTISTGLNSEDNLIASGYDIGGVAGISNLAKVKSLVDSVGTNEGFAGKYFMANTSQDCESADFTKLSAIDGLCFEEPRKHGSYGIAGLAFHAHNTDLRTEAGFPGVQNIDSYTVDLAESFPKLEFFAGVGRNKVVSFVPNCGFGVCTLVDLAYDPATNAEGGSVYFAFEDSDKLEGRDSDQDLGVQIDWCVGLAACTANPIFTAKDHAGTAITEAQVQFYISSPLANTGGAQYAGYTVSGATTTDPGYINKEERQLFCDDDYTETFGGKTFAGYCYADKLTGGPANKVVPGRVTTFTVDDSAARFLPSPLSLAAKYGSFTDLNDNDKPDLREEWDSKDENGQPLAGGDGIPDNYFPVKNPSVLGERLGRVLSVINTRTASGGGTAVVANEKSGVGAVFQALFQPEVKVGNESVTWGGVLQGIFLDRSGYFREDGNDNAVLDNYATDPIIEIRFDVTQNATFFKRYTDDTKDATGQLVTTDGVARPLSELNSLWNARDELAKVPQLGIETNRTYSDKSETGRYMMTWIDTDGDKIVDSGEYIPFEGSSFPRPSTSSHNARYLGLDSSAPLSQGKNIVDYIRGKEGILGFRNRTIAFPGDASGTPKPWILGDIIHSDPLFVDVPSESYETVDASYLAFKTQYEKRRQMIYVGGNDGMLHAFNAGDFDDANQRFLNSPPGVTVQHELGSELWSYVPMNLLPHLQWLTSPSYEHNYYVDGSPRAYDVKAFSADATHPGGWGTILVIGFRLGGGLYAIDPNSDPDADRTDDLALASAYVVFDITDPEQPPQLLAEIATPGLNYTITAPAVVKSLSTGEWKLLVGSGPDVVRKAESTQTAKLFTYDIASLIDKSSVTPAVVDVNFAKANNSFVGNLHAKDWNDDGTDDYAYFGTVNGTASASGGKLLRLNLTSGAAYTSGDFAKLLSDDLPFFEEPAATKDILGNQWLLTGSGRILAQDDNRNNEANFFVGLRLDGALNRARSTLADSDGVVVRASGAIEDALGNSIIRGGSTVATTAEFSTYVASKKGWYKTARKPVGAPSGRFVTSAVFFRNLAIFADYVPNDSECNPEGTTRLYAIDYASGIADLTFGFSVNNDVDQVIGEHIDIFGLIGDKLSVIESGNGNPRVIGQSSTGETINKELKSPNVAPGKGGRMSWKEISLEDFLAP